MSRSGFHEAIEVPDLPPIAEAVDAITDALFSPDLRCRLWIERMNRPYGYENGRCIECGATNGGHYGNCAAID